MATVTTLQESGGSVPEAPSGSRSSLRGLLLTSVLMVAILTLLLGVVYPLIMTGIGQVLFHDQANGSLLKNARGQVIGSKLIGQAFAKPQYFHGRASAAGKGYDATSSGGTNLGPTSATLLKSTIALAKQIRTDNGLPANYPLPADAVSSSASGLDPEISPAYADLQVARVARIRALSAAAVRALVAKYTSGRTLGFLGEPRVNVLQLNLALDALKR